MSAVAPYTMTTPASIVALAEAVRHVVHADTPGAFVECGVWKGGSMLVVARTLLEEGVSDRELILMDTFDGMVAPSEADVHRTGESANEMLARDQQRDQSLLWARAPLDGVKQVLQSSGYPASQIRYVEGRVEETLPHHAPGRIALLRLDTDWYASTMCELTHLYPRLERGGVLIIDDYGWWRGQQQAVDEYFKEQAPRPLLVRIDEGGARIAVKP